MRIGETEIGEQCKDNFILFPPVKLWPYNFKVSFTIYFQENTWGIDVWINFASVSVIKCWKGSVREVLWN